MSPQEAVEDWANRYAHEIFQDATEGLAHIEPEDVPTYIWEPIEEAIVDLAIWVNDHGQDLAAARKAQLQQQTA